MSEQPIRILLVEDEPDVRTIAEGVLASFGFAVTAVSNGSEALACLNAARPDVILSDIRMPVVDGFQLLQRIRADPIWHQIPFIIISAKAESADLRMGMSLGADDYLTKPYRPEDIRRTIQIRVQRARQVAEAIANHQRLLTHILPHELRTPLMGVIGYADLMVDAAAEEKTLTVAELAEYGRMLQISGTRIFRIVENLLFWARLETARSAAEGPDRARPALEVVSAWSLRRVVDAAAKQFGRQMDAVVEVPAEARIQVAMPGFEFAASHLVENAFKYSLPGTQVRVAARMEGGLLQVSVSDRGRGMSREQLERVGMVRPFEGRGLGQHGLGMGLMLASTFARLSGGQLDLQPGANGTGLNAVMSLPLEVEVATVS
jgi:two-component system sensor histidine kinase/response regulator